TVDAAPEGARCGFAAQDRASARSAHVGRAANCVARSLTPLPEHSSMRVPTLLVVSALVLGGCASVNVKKTCDGDGVCRVERRGEHTGVVRQGAPPHRLAPYEGKAHSAPDARKRADEAYLQAPKRPASEPIRLVLIGPNTETPDLAPLASTYRQMFEQALQGD